MYSANGFYILGSKQKSDSSPESTDFTDSTCFLGVAKLAGQTLKTTENLISNAETESTAKRSTKSSRESTQKSSNVEFTSRHNMEWRFTHLDNR